MIEIIEISVEDTYPIRKSVLRDGMSLSHKMAGDQEAETLHLGVYDSGQLVCIGSFMKALKADFKGSQYQLRGMACDRGTEGNGYGTMLLKKAEQILKEKEVDILWCNARVIALGFYRKLGYQSIGSLFEVDQVGPHYVMFKKLS